MKTILRKKFPITATLLLLTVCTAAIAVTLPGSIFVSATASGGLSWFTASQEHAPSLNAWYASRGNSSAFAFLANPSADLDQCANDPMPSPSTDGCNSSSTKWVNGNLGASKSVYFEGDSIPYRLRFGNLPLTSHQVVIEWDTTKSGKHALDYITTFNQSVLNANPCLGVTGCDPNVGGYTEFAIPADPQVTGAGVTPTAGNLRLYGGSITAVSAYSYPTGTGFSGDKSARITITFTPTRANPVLAWGGHISTRKDWGDNGSAVAISGSPYHTRLIDLDGSGGNQDRSLSAAAVIFPGSITIIKDATPNGSTSFPFSASPTPLADFSLVDDGTSANTKVFSNIINFQNYTVTENTPSGWTMNSASCVVASPNGGSQNVSGSTATINLAEGENVTCTYLNTANNPALSIVKTATETGFSAVGDVINYSIIATNTGNTTLSSVTVTDPNASNLTCTPANGSSLAPNATMSCTASHTITQADIDAGSYYNQACVDDGTGGAAQACSDVTTPGSKNPSLTITKTATESGFSQVGDVIHYTIVAKNNGNVTLSSVTVTDPNATGLTCTPANGSSLAPNDTMNCTATHTITQADIDAGSYYNQACVDDGAGGAAQACSDVTTPGSKNPHLTITKTATESGFSQVGDVIHYTIVATNDGNVTLSNVTVTDSQVSDLSCTPSNPVASLAPGASITCTASHTIVQADLDAGSFYNQACVDDGANGAAQACDDETTTGTKNPHLSIDKVATESGYNAVGQVIHYTVTATNDGNVTLHNVTVTDAQVTNLSCTPSNPVADLAPGGSITCTASHTITQGDLDAGSFYNQACVDDGANGAAQACDAVTTPGTQSPHLSITKVATESGFSAVGDVIHYTIVATNDGNVTLSNVTVSDPNAPDLNCSPSNPVASLAPGASITCTASHTITQADLDAGSFYNQACVDDGASGAAQACDDETTTGTKNPQLTILKTATESGFSQVGDVIHYTIVATNSGNVTLHNVNVTDAQVTDLGCTPATPVANLAPGSTITCTATHTVTQADIDAGSYYNQACVDDGAGGADGKCSDVTTPASQNPHLSLNKTAAETSFNAVGQVIHYTITATNDGNVTLSSVTVTDPNASGLSCTPVNGSSLAPGASMVCTASHTITLADLDAGHYLNAACVDDGPGGAAQQCDNEDTPGQPAPDVSIDKAGNGPIDAGQTATFTITVSSIGNATASGVTLSDTLPSGLTWTLGGTDAGDCQISGTALTCNFGNLAPGVTKTFTVSATTPSGSCATLTNTASIASGNDTNSSNNSDGDSITVRCPNLSITKTPDKTGDSGYSITPGDTASFTITVANSGSGAAQGVVISDTLPAAPPLTWSVTSETPNLGVCSIPDSKTLGCNVGTLAAGASFTVVVTSSPVPSDFIQGSGAAAPIEIDGNLLDDLSVPGEDWETDGVDCTTNPKVGCDIDKPTGQTDDSFGQGTKEDTAVPTVVAGSIPNNKSDLLRFYVSSERAAGADFVYLAWERVQEPNGTTNMDFEFNQSSSLTANNITPVRTAGDILVKYDLDRGGTTPTLGWQVWLTGGGSASSLCEASTTFPCWSKVKNFTGNVVGAINKDGPVVDPLQPDAPRTLSIRTFGEARIDLASVFQFGGCVNFGSAYLKSRSSSSFTSEIKDFIAPIPVNITTCPDKELNNTAYASATNFKPANGNLGDSISDTGKIIVTLAQAALRPVSSVLEDAIAAARSENSIPTPSGDDVVSQVTVDQAGLSAASPGEFAPSPRPRYVPLTRKHRIATE